MAEFPINIHLNTSRERLLGCLNCTHDPGDRQNPLSSLPLVASCMVAESPGQWQFTHRVDTEYHFGSKAQFWPATVIFLTSSALMPKLDPWIVTWMPPPNGPVLGWI